MKPALRQAVTIVAIFVAALGVLVLAAWLALPGWIEARWAPDLARRYGLGDIRLDIRRIGLTGLDADDIRIGSMLEVDHLAVDVRPGDLIRGRIQRIVLSGVTVHAVRDENGIRLAGMPSAPADPKEAGSTGAPAFWVGRVEVRGGLLVLAHNGTDLKLPFSLTAVAEGQDLARISARLELFPHQNPIGVMLRADTARGDLAAVVQARDTRLNLLEGLLPPAADLQLGGRISARLEARLELAPLQLLSLQGEAASADLSVWTPDFELAAAGAPTPLHLAWAAAGPHDLTANFSGGLKLVRPLAAAVENLRITAALAPGTSGRAELAIAAGASLRTGGPLKAHFDTLSFKTAGHLDDQGRPAGSARLEVAGRIDDPLALSIDRLRLAAAGDAGRIDVTGDFAVSAADGLIPEAWKIVPSVVKGSLSGRLEDLVRWQARLQMAPSRTVVDLAAGGLKARITEPRLNIDLSGQASALTFAARFRSRQGHLAPDAVSIQWPALDVDAEGRLDPGNPLASADIGFAVQLPRCAAANDEFQAGTQKIQARGRIRPGQHPALSAELQAASGRIVWPGQGLAVEDIDLHLPLQWPAVNPAVGSLAMALVPPRGLNPGRLRAAVRQSGPGLTLDGALQDIFFTGTTLKIDAAAGLTDDGLTARLDTALAPWSPPTPVDLGILAPAASGLMVDGRLALDAALALKAGRLQSSARLRVSDASVAAPDKHIRVAGIQTDFELVDLAALRSAPGQVVRFAEAGLGSVLLRDGAIQFQVEAPHQVLLEKGAFGWCGGRVYAEAMRFSPAVDDYDLTLFCDRLALADLLDQVGGLTAEGGGTVNGRIPVHYSGGRLDFNDGFLYSSPGDGGKIRLTGVERLTGSIGPETAAYAQLALASEALKDYDYSWAKVGIDSQDDQLALRLQFDGKPAHPLPFVYRRELGRFVRVEADNPGSRFQGISLDVNLRLPLNRILQYGGLMKMMP